MWSGVSGISIKSSMGNNGSRPSPSPVAMENENKNIVKAESADLHQSASPTPSNASSSSAGNYQEYHGNNNNISTAAASSFSYYNNSNMSPPRLSEDPISASTYGGASHLHHHHQYHHQNYSYGYGDPAKPASAASGSTSGQDFSGQYSYQQQAPENLNLNVNVNVNLLPTTAAAASEPYQQSQYHHHHQYYSQQQLYHHHHQQQQHHNPHLAAASIGSGSTQFTPPPHARQLLQSPLLQQPVRLTLQGLDPAVLPQPRDVPSDTTPASLSFRGPTTAGSSDHHLVHNIALCTIDDDRKSTYSKGWEGLQGQAQEELVQEEGRDPHLPGGQLSQDVHKVFPLEGPPEDSHG